MLSERDRRLSVLVLEHRLLTRAQLDECRARTVALGASLEQILLERGFLSPAELHELHAAPPRFAEIARERGLASESQVLDALRVKDQLAAVDVHRPLGSILVERAVLSDTQVVEILAEQTRRAPECRGPWRLGEQLPRGRAGTVHRAVHATSGKEAVVKTLPGGASALPRLLRARAIDHPNLARLLDAGADGDVLWVAAEHVEGLPLYDHVVGSIRLPLEEAVGTMKQVVAAVAAAHRAGLAHGRLTPRNVLLTEMREVRLTDLALSAGDRAADVRACGELWAFLLEGERPGASPRFAGLPAIAAAIYARAFGGRYAGIAALADDLDLLDEELLRLAHQADAAADAAPAPTPVPTPPSVRARPGRRRRR